MIYRPASAADLPAIAGINLINSPNGLRAAFGLELTTLFFQYYFQEGGPFVVAEEDGQVVGSSMGYYAGTTARYRFETEHDAEIRAALKLAADHGNPAALRFFTRPPIQDHAEPLLLRFGTSCKSVMLSLGVLPEFRRRGIARDLMMRFIETVKLCGAENNYLETQTDNLPARRTYLSCGYTEILSDDKSVWYRIAF